MLAVIDETLFGTGCAFELATSVGEAQCNIQRGFSRGTGQACDESHANQAGALGVDAQSGGDVIAQIQEV